MRGAIKQRRRLRAGVQSSVHSQRGPVQKPVGVLSDLCVCVYVRCLCLCVGVKRLPLMADGFFPQPDQDGLV